jgi:Group II intron, maturase-specific domain
MPGWIKKLLKILNKISKRIGHSKRPGIARRAMRLCGGRRCYSTKTGKVYIGTRPSQKKVKGIIERISQRTGRDTLKQETTEKVRELNALVVGWGNYFRLGPVSNRSAGSF